MLIITIFHNDKVATMIIAPTSLTDHYLWIPEGITGDVVPGSDSSLTYLQSKYATMNALQNATHNTNNAVPNEISNIQTETDNLETTNQQHVSNDLHYHTSHTGFMYQRNNTNNDNSISFIAQQNYLTFQRKGNQELQVQALNIIISDLQTQINSITGSSGGHDPEAGTM